MVVKHARVRTIDIRTVRSANSVADQIATEVDRWEKGIITTRDMNKRVARWIKNATEAEMDAIFAACKGA